MANDYFDLTELAKINDANVVDLGLSDILDDAPLMAQLAAIPASNGTTHKWNVKTTAPVTAFRAVNDGRENDHTEKTTRSINLAILDASFLADLAIANGYRKGRDAFLELEASAHLRAAFFLAERAFIYGTVADAAAHTGLAELTTLDGLADAMVVNAGGTTAATGSSVFLIRTGDNDEDVAVVAGDDGKLIMEDPVIQRAAGSATGFFPGYFVAISGWLGLQYGGAYSVARIANLTEDSGKGLTDDLIYEALSKFPASRGPNLIVMNRRSAKQLRASRTATNATGAPAPRPTDVEGIPIVVTDSVVSTETLLA